MDAATIRGAPGAPHVVIAAPGLAALPDEVLARSRALAQLAALAQHQVDTAGLEHALVDAIGIATPAATLMAHGAGLDATARDWLVADPVTLVAGIDDVLLAARVDDLSGDESASLAARLSAHFAGDGLAFVAAHPARWYVRLATPARIAALPTGAAVRRTLGALRVEGDDARRFARHANEIQMLLHAAPENEAREARGLAPCNGLWLWNTAARQAEHVPLRIAALAATGAAGDLARGLALVTQGSARDIDANAASLAAAIVAGGATHVVVALPDVVAPAFASIDAQCLAPAVDALLGGRAGRLTLVADGRDAHAYTASRPRAWRRFALRWRAAPFAIDG
jgi:hypothetical protein